MKLFPRTTMLADSSLSGAPEAIPTLTLSPDRVAEALQLEESEVLALLHSVEGRKKILENLKQNPKLLESSITPESLQNFQTDLEDMGQYLAAEERFLQAQKDPEKKNMFRRSWDAMRAFPAKHPWITVTLLGVVLGVVAAYMGWLPRIDFPGLWGRVQAFFRTGSLAAASEGISPAADAATSALPAGVEVPLGTIESLYPEVRIFDHSFMYNNEVFTMEQLPELLKKLPQLSAEQPLKVMPYSNSRAAAESALKHMLQNAGVSVDQTRWTEELMNQEFIPNP